MSDAELGLLRGGQSDLADPAAAVQRAQERATKDVHTHRTIKALTDSDWQGAAELLTRLRD
ncbi:MAG: hypothetical protein K2Y29_20515, partial [Beijerinckiaceae bacterium]|nr:hypothetical protein [Beijerinckiaceae bacterium]